MVRDWSPRLGHAGAGWVVSLWVGLSGVLGPGGDRHSLVCVEPGAVVASTLNTIKCTGNWMIYKI